VPHAFGERNVPAVLQQLAAQALQRKSAYLRGEVVERSNPIFSGGRFHAFYAAIPVILPDDFRIYTSDNGEQAVFVWMVPITKLEAAYVRTKGWSSFEALLEAQNADLVDLQRPDFTQMAMKN
jgi:hypothetical protein